MKKKRLQSNEHAAKILRTGDEGSQPLQSIIKYIFNTKFHMCDSRNYKSQTITIHLEIESKRIKTKNLVVVAVCVRERERVVLWKEM